MSVKKICSGEINFNSLVNKLIPSITIERISVKAWQAKSQRSGLAHTFFSKGCFRGSLEWDHKLLRQRDLYKTALLMDSFSGTLDKQKSSTGWFTFACSGLSNLDRIRARVRTGTTTITWQICRHYKGDAGATRLGPVVGLTQLKVEGPEPQKSCSCTVMEMKKH